MGQKRTKPKVSIIMPAYNSAKTLRQAIESIIHQTFENWELLILDDGSSDQTGLIADQMAKMDGRIRVYHFGHEGLVAMLERGCELAAGEYIARMDADDVAHPERLQLQLDWLLARPHCDVVGTLVALIGQLPHSEGYSLYAKWTNSLVDHWQIYVERFIDSPIVHPTVMFKRELLDRLGGYRKGPFPEDYELWLRWLDRGVWFEKVPKVLYFWLDHQGRLSRQDPRYGEEAIYRLKAIYLARELGRSAAGRCVWIWGAGRRTRKRLRFLLEQGVSIAGFIDVDQQKIGRKIWGVPVCGLHQIPQSQTAVVVSYVAKRGAREFIRSVLGRQGYEEGRNFWIAA